MTFNSSLLRLIDSTFSKEELVQLCFELQVDHENFSERKLSFVQELIIHFYHHGRLSELITYCQKGRPNEQWPDPTAAYSKGELLGETPRRLLPYEPETIYVPSGRFIMGHNPDNSEDRYESPEHKLDLQGFRLGKYPVTNSQYAEFLRRRNEKLYRPVKSGWFLDTPPQDKLDHPVVGISWHAANAYCQWLSEVTGITYRLPTEAEWEKGARGEDGRQYPWGNKWNLENCLAITGETVPLFIEASDQDRRDPRPGGQSPFGHCDMSGHIEEWTNTIWGEAESTPDYCYPYSAADGREDLIPSRFRSNVFRIYRGGKFEMEPQTFTCFSRGCSPDDTALFWRGFRVACDY